MKRNHVKHVPPCPLKTDHLITSNLQEHFYIYFKLFIFTFFHKTEFFSLLSSFIIRLYFFYWIIFEHISEHV